MGSLQALQDRFHRPLAYSLKVALGDTGEALARAVSAVCQSGARVGELALASLEADRTVVYDLRVFAANDQQMAQVRQDVQAAGAKVLGVLDLAMESHRGGSCEMRSRTPIRSNTDLRIVYTPGVARVCKAIQADPSLAREYTGVANKVAIATNGTAILGLGDIGCLAGLPVMEGKSAIFWEFVKLSAEPVLIDTHDADEFISIMEKLAVGFGAVQIEDVAAPACFKITRELDKRLKIPVMHDDQHGTATIVTAGLLSALRKTGRKIGDLSCAISGAGAAGTAITELLQLAGIGDVVLVDRAGLIYRGRKENMNAEKVALAERTNKEHPGRPGGGHAGTRPVHRRQPAQHRQPGDGPQHGQEPDRLRAGQPDQRNQRGGRVRGGGGHRGRRADDEQRPGLSGHLPRGDGRRGGRHHRADDDGGGRRAGRSRQRR